MSEINSKTLEWDGIEPLQAFTGKACNGCTACCHSVPVVELGLKAFCKCPHEVARKGCRIYAMRPRSCRMWSCGWLIGDLPERFRPDKIGVVLDPLPDLVRINGEDVPAAQFWVLPGYERAWECDRDVMALVESQIDAGFVVLWRIRDPKTGGQSAIVFGKTPEGELWANDQGLMANKENLGTDTERLWRAQQLTTEVIR